jgi:hypothetical protein
MVMNRGRLLEDGIGGEIRAMVIQGITDSEDYENFDD